MEKISRRKVFEAAAVIAGGVLANEAVAAADKAAEPKGKTESIYKFRLGEAPARTFGDSSIREHKLKDFPISASMSAGLVRLAPGSFREPHWHPNSDEWLMVLSGRVLMTIVDPKGDPARITLDPLDVGFTPQGFGHYVENVSEGESQVLLVHNHADFTTIELSEWVAGGKVSIFASTLNIPEEAFANAPKERIFIGKKKKKA